MFDPARPALPERGESMLSPEDQNAALNAQNRWRGRYNSPPLTRDNGLAAFALDWAAPREGFSVLGKLGDDDAI